MNKKDFILHKSRRLYRMSCKTCGCDRGYQRSRENNKNCRSCENVVKFTGKIHSEESKKKRSAWNQGIDIGEFKDFLHNREKRDRHHFAKIARSIFERDLFICNCCSKYGGTLNAHHLESFNSNPELRFEKTNIITLCEKCHLDFHVKYGRGNNTKQQYEEYKEKYGKKQMVI